MTRDGHTDRDRSGGLVAFSWRYLRKYVPWSLLGLASILAYATSTVVLLVLFKLVLSEVIQTDTGSSPLLEQAESAPDLGPERTFRRLLTGDADFDFDAAVDRGFVVVREALGLGADDVIWLIPLLFASVFFLRSLAAFATGYIFQVVGLSATNDIRDALYERILGQSSRFFMRHTSGELVSRLSTDIAVMQNAVSSRMLDLIQQSVTLVFLIGFLFLIDFRLALICVVAVPLLVYPIVRFGQGMRRTSRASQERMADLASLVSEAVRGNRVVKAFGMEGFELARFRRSSHRHLRIRLRAQFLAKVSSPVIETMIACGAAAFLVQVGYAVRTGSMTPSQIMAFLANVVMLYDPIRKLNAVNLNLQEAAAALQRVRDVMLVENDVVQSADAVELDDAEPRIDLEGVTFSYGREPVLRGVDLTIEPGEIVALVGPSGSGKSTLVSLLPRFFDPDEGRVLLGGRDVRSVTLDSLRAQIGIVTQETVLFNDTVRNNIAYGRDDLPIARVREAAAAAYADEFITGFPDGYDTIVGEGGLSVSGGERQRLAIARAILKDPPILVLDEATSHLDTESEALVQKALYNLMSGRTSLVIAHRLSTIQRATRIVVMQAGRIVEEGTHEELLERAGLYRRLYELQFQDIEIP